MSPLSLIRTAAATTGDPARAKTAFRAAAERASLCPSDYLTMLFDAAYLPDT